MQADCTQKFISSSNEKVVGGNPTWTAPFRTEKKTKREHDIAPSSSLLLPEDFKLTGCFKMQKENSNF